MGNRIHLGRAKDMTPCSELLWTDFLRRGPRKMVEDHFVKAREKALAKSHDVPGWCGPALDG